jgi:hypothetical protein
MGYGSRAIQLLQQYYRGKLNQIGLTMNKNGNEVKELTKKCSEMMEIDEVSLKNIVIHFTSK